MNVPAPLIALSRFRLVLAAESGCAFFCFGKTGAEGLISAIAVVSRKCTKDQSSS